MDAFRQELLTCFCSEIRTGKMKAGLAAWSLWDLWREGTIRQPGPAERSNHIATEDWPVRHEGNRQPQPFVLQRYIFRRSTMGIQTAPLPEVVPNDLSGIEQC
jgi:hypothetical protein